MSYCAHQVIDGVEPIAEGKEEEEDSDVEENGDSVGQASHLELGKPIEEIGARSATFVTCRIRL